MPTEGGKRRIRRLGEASAYYLVEYFFQKLEWFRRIATKYDKLDVSFLAFVSFASIAILLI